jgi:hypothetical protein
MTGRPSAEYLCRQCIAILDLNLPDAETVRKLRDMFEIPDPDPEPAKADPQPWPILRDAD